MKAKCLKMCSELGCVIMNNLPRSQLMAQDKSCQMAYAYKNVGYQLCERRSDGK